VEKDPVCGMQVDPQNAATKTEHQGKTYHFCSAVCKKTFDAIREQYTRP
jgi:Cu+-exporting ATPase